MSGLISKIRTGETPFYARLKRLLKQLLRASLPVPRFLAPVCRFSYELHYVLLIGGRWLLTCFYRSPLFRSRCAKVGSNLQITLMPWVFGSIHIEIGEDVSFFGKLDIMSGRLDEKPRLVIGDRTGIGHGVSIFVAREVVIEDDVLVASHCTVSDNDRHPKNAIARASGQPVTRREVRPVRICRFAWIGQGSCIMKGVTIGEGAIVGANSVVISDIPPYSIAIGNPAQVYFRDIGRASAEHVQREASHRTKQPPQE